MLTFVIPVAPYHEAVADRAVASCRAQTVTCRLVVVPDPDRRGAGWARNQGLARVETPFVAFLDADDWLEPTFAEATLRAYDGLRYVYTDWWQDETQRVEAPDAAWGSDGRWHVITALLPTQAVKTFGGFDETLPGGEDTDFYWKLTRNHVCGKRLPQALFHYGDGGQRSLAFHQRADFPSLRQQIFERYKGKPMDDCQGCGEPNHSSPPTNQPQPGDVLAETLWQGTRQERGRATGRLYRGGWGAQVWMHPADIDAAPHLFARVVEMPPALDEAALAEFQRVVGESLGVPPLVRVGGSDGRTIPVTVDDPPAALPDVQRVLTLYGQRTAQPQP